MIDDKVQSTFFYQLTPEKILAAVESAGLRTTGRCSALNSMENRVYEVEIEVLDDTTLSSPSERFRIAKFYRPGRWSESQILEEHQFLLDLADAEIPVVAPIAFEDGKTLHKTEDSAIWFALFSKRGGRAPDELDFEKAKRIGRLMARIHIVGAQRKSERRITLDPQTYGKDNLDFVLQSNIVSIEVAKRYEAVVNEILFTITPLFSGVVNQRIHGDCHLGNLIFGSQGLFIVDFDDMVNGPCVQDLWLLVPGKEEEDKALFNTIIDGYEELRTLDRNLLRLVEPLRTLRLIHYSTWIARRWEDPAFKRVFEHFASPQYWPTQLAYLEQQLAIVKDIK